MSRSGLPFSPAGMTTPTSGSSAARGFLPSDFNMRTRFLALSFALACTTVASAENWERFRGPNGSGTVADKDVPLTFDAKQGQNVLWKLAMPGPGNSSPVVWGKHLFIQTSSADS